MKAYAVLVVFLMLGAGMFITGTPVADDATFTASAAPTDTRNGEEPLGLPTPMSLLLNSRRADRGPFFLSFQQIYRDVTSIASIYPGEDYAKVFRYPYGGAQEISSKYNRSLEESNQTKLDLYLNSMDVPNKKVRFKIEIDRDGDGNNDTTIDFPEYITGDSNEPEHVVLNGTVYFRELDKTPKDMRRARMYLKIWRTDTINDHNNRLKVYAGFLSDTEMKIESKIILPWINPVPHVEINKPFDYNKTGWTYFNNEPIEFDGRGSNDPSGEDLGYVWTFDRLGYPTVYDRDLFNRSFKEPGFYTITLNVSNSLYFTNETSVTIKVLYFNHPPVLTVQQRVGPEIFESVQSPVKTYTHVNTEWRSIITDVDDDLTTLHWDFGDGFTSTSKYVNHSYKKEGEFVLKVTAFDGNTTNGRVVKSFQVVVHPNHEPVGIIDVSAPAFEWITPSPSDPRYRGLEVRVNLGDSVVFDATNSFDPDGQPIRTFKWDFDDVYATEDNPTIGTQARSSHRFMVEGEYNVTLTLFDGVKYGYLNVWVRTNNAPIVVPPALLPSETNKEISFDGSRSSDPDGEDELEFKWDFGDNTRTEWSESRHDAHTYTVTATYTVTLWVTDGLMTQSATSTIRIDPENHEPVAVASIAEDPEDLWTNMSIHFSSAGSYDIDGEGRISFTWDFDDGTDPSTLANPEHEYEDPGTYEVVLTVIDQKATIATDKLILTVQRNYGDTDIVMKALESSHRGGHTYVDPEPGQMAQVAVMRTGWVAYLCDLKKGQEMEVTINVIGERPVDIYLFREVHFQTYKRNPQVTFVPFEASGYKQGAVGEHKFTYKAQESDRYYVVIDNKDWPLGTDTEGPVDYTITIKALWEDDEGIIPGFGTAVTVLAMTVVVAVAVITRFRRD